MVGLNVMGWMLQYWPPRAHGAHLHSFTIVVLFILTLVIRVGAFACIYYFVRGRNWARIVVLLTSVLVIISGLIYFHQEDTPRRISTIAWCALGVFFLYWLNTRPIREFFTQGAAPAERF